MTGLPFAEPLRAVVEALRRLGIQHFVGGSVATVLHGEIRTTQDVDLVVELEERHIEGLVAALRADFFVDEEALRLAIGPLGSCNLVHRGSGFKVDLFVRRERAFSRSEMQRRMQVELAGGLRLDVATAEDCVLTKLEWFEKGGRVSDRQWRDVLGVLRISGDGLDRAYLARWAQELGLDELLAAAMREAFGASR